MPIYLSYFKSLNIFICGQNSSLYISPISGISLKYDGKELTDGEVITIGIQKKDGAFSVGPEEIEVYDNNVNDYMVYLVKDTGKHYVEELQ